MERDFKACLLAIGKDEGTYYYKEDDSKIEALSDEEYTAAKTEYDSKQYARDRAVAYPSLTEQADMAYWDRQNGTTTLDDAIMAVKAKYPKGVI